MVYFSTTADITTHFGPLVGCYDYATHTQHPDTDKALALANLKPGESVLDVGAGGGRFIARAKRAVDGGLCVAVDAVQGFLTTDIPWMLEQHGLAATQVHCLQANITSTNFTATVRAIPGASQGFDCVVALHLFTTLPPQDRRPALVALRQLLKPSGRLILNMSARFTNAAPTDASTPVQFRATPHTEALGATIYTTFRRDGPQIAIPQAGAASQFRKVVDFAIQTAPDQLWTVAAAQARDAAQNAGFLVSRVEPVGKGNDFGLPDGRHSPSQAALNTMSFQDILRTCAQPPVTGAYNCCGRLLEAFTSHVTPDWQQTSQDVRNYHLAEQLQMFLAKEEKHFVITNATLPPGGAVLHKKVEPAQVGVLVLLNKM